MSMNISSVRMSALALLSVLLLACSTTTVKSTQYVQVVQDTAPPEDLLLDVGVTVFDPGIDEVDRDEEERVSPGIRNAEAR